jgi:hypothetical protein
MVKRNLPGISMEQLGAAQQAAIDEAERMRGKGEKVRYIRSTSVPDEGSVMCLFEATSPAVVARLNDNARIPYDTVVEAKDLTPGAVLQYG